MIYFPLQEDQNLFCILRASIFSWLPLLLYNKRILLPVLQNFLSKFSGAKFRLLSDNLPKCRGNSRHAAATFKVSQHPFIDQTAQSSDFSHKCQRASPCVNKGSQRERQLAVPWLTLARAFTLGNIGTNPTTNRIIEIPSRTFQPLNHLLYYICQLSETCFSSAIKPCLTPAPKRKARRSQLRRQLCLSHSSSENTSY